MKTASIPSGARTLSAFEKKRSEIGSAPRTRIRTAWMATAAIVVIALLAIPFLLRWRDPIRRLAALTPRSERIAEARISGGFAWAPYRGPVRTSDEASDAQRMMLGGVAGELIKAAEMSKTSEAQHLAGIARVLTGSPSDAVPVLQEAAQREQSNANAWNDLAAAEYSSALALGRVSLYPEALAHADRALRVDAGLREALFNRALILERLAYTQQAREAWDRYVNVDGSSQWASEAREHLARLQSKTAASTFKAEEQRLRAAAVSGDQKTVDAIVDRYRQLSRAAAEADYLGRWGTTQSADEIAVARAIGGALVHLSGESLLHDAVAAIDVASPSKLATIAEAHAIYRRGRVAYSQHHVAEAEPDLRRAAELFAHVNDPMSFAARYYAANTRFDQNDAHGASAELDRLRREVDAHPRYVALGALVRWEIMLCAIHDRDWNAVVATASEATAAFQRIGEKRNLAVILTMRADALLFLGRPDDAWSDRIVSLRLMDAEGDAIRLPIAVCEAADVEIAVGHLESGRALLGLAEQASRGGQDYAFLTYILARDAMTAAKLHLKEEASQEAQRATLVAMRVADPALRARATADAHLAAGAIETASDPRLAIARLSRSVDMYAAAGTPLLVVEAKLLRARAEMRAGDRESARRDLDEGIAQVEKQPIRGTFVDDAGRGLFQEAIALALDRGDVATAFAYAERSRNAHAVDVATLQQRLRRSGAAILEVAELADGTAVFCVTESSIDVARQKFAVDVSSDLYDVVVRPFEMQLGRSRQVIVVAGDTPLQNVAFAALYDAKQRRHLVEQMPVSIAETASSLEVSHAVVPRSVVAVALNSRDGTRELPGSVQEVNDISGLYPRSMWSGANVGTLMRDAVAADVIHISGHTERLAGGGDDALLFDDTRLSGGIVASMSLGHPIVVLAACETLRAAPSSRALSVGGGFLAAGATAVVGTLEPISDNEAREIFRDVHRGLAAGESPAVAVQHAQLDAMARHSSAWRAVALLVSRITNAE